MKYLEKIQNLLPLGYLYLIILGLLKESILFYQLGINILNYSSITDILISPISDLTSRPLLIILIFGFIVLMLLVQFILVKKSHKNWVKKILGKTGFNEQTSKSEISHKTLRFFGFFIAFELLFFFVGMGVGKGKTYAEMITNDNVTHNYKVTFNSGKVEDIYVVGSNSSYYFYVTKGNKNIKISPVGTINSLELIDNKKLK